MKVLVTGSRGYIGSALAKTLHTQGITPFGIDRNGRPDGSAIYGVFSDACITEDVIVDCVMDSKIDTIFHLAASADVGESVRDPAEFYYNNIGRTSLMFAKLMQKGWRGKVVFSSTAAVYDSGDYDGPIYEFSSIGSPNPYGKSKYACEQLFHDLNRAYNIPVVIFRYFNVAGAWDDVGDHLDAGHIISRLCHCAFNDKPFTLFGTDKNTWDGTCVRDYLHVRDVCDAHIHAAKYIDSATAPFGVQTFNLGTGVGWSNKDIIDAFTRFTGRKVEVIDGLSRDGDPDYLIADATKYHDQAGYRYTHSSLEHIITTAWNYYCNRME